LLYTNGNEINSKKAIKKVKPKVMAFVNDFFLIENKAKTLSPSKKLIKKTNIIIKTYLKLFIIISLLLH
jgi:hypothetical protein